MARGRPPGNKTLIAQNALKAAIESETTEVRAELAAAEQRIDELEALLAKISDLARREVEIKPRGIPPPLPKVPEPELPSGPKVELDLDDDLGEGRWC